MQIRSNYKTALFVFSLSTGLIQIRTQQPASQGQREKNEIRLNVVVSGVHDAAIHGLSQQDLTIFDNGTQRPIDSFQEISATTHAVQVLIVVDALNTPYSALSYQRDQIVKYLRLNDGRLAYATSFAVVTDKGVEIHNSPTTDGMALANDLEHYDIGLRMIGARRDSMDLLTKQRFR